MDNSSRNIVKFIAAITFAILLIMAARFYAESRREPVPVVAEQASEGVTPLADMPAQGNVEENATDLENSEYDAAEEDPEPIMGEPSMNLETGSAPSYNPSALAEPSVEPKSTPE